MADLIQEAFGFLKQPKVPSVGGAGFSLPQIDPLMAALVAEIILTVAVIFYFIYIFKVYRIIILEVEDRGRGFKAKLLKAKPMTENGIPKYAILGKKDENGKQFKINASPSDNLIPLQTIFGFYKDIIIMHKDKNGDYRPWKVITHPDQLNLDDYLKDVDGQKEFEGERFIKELLPLLKIDNLKMRAWYNLKMKEIDADFMQKGQLMKKYGNIIFIMLIIFAVGLAAWYLLG